MMTVWLLYCCLLTKSTRYSLLYHAPHDFFLFCFSCQNNDVATYSMNPLPRG